MEEKITKIIFILITLALVNEMSINVLAKENNKRRFRDKTGGFRKNICDVTDRESKVHCYCENSRELKNATKAECWVFNSGISKDDVIWQSFASQPTLKTLSFSIRVDGTLSYIPSKALQYLKDLRSITIRYAAITDITPYAFNNLTNLTEIILPQNEIESFHQHAFAHLPNLTLINLEDNMITEIGTEVFYDLPELQRIVFTKNNISSIANGAFQYMYKLLDLFLNRNNIFHMNRHTFDGLANLRKLDLRQNHIHNLTEFTFAELWNLQELLLGKNNLKFVSERAFDGLSQLKKLLLDDNKLVTLPSGLFAGVRGLISLDLRSNELYTLTLDNIRPILDNLKSQNSNLLLQENNFVCDCRLKWIHSLRNETQSQNTILALDNITCTMDPNLVSSTYTKTFHVIESKKEQNDEILQADIITGPLKEKINVTDKENMYKNKYSDSRKVPTKVSLTRTFFNIPPENLPCPREPIKTTEPPQIIMDPVMPLQNKIKTNRHQEMNSANRLFRIAIVFLVPVVCTLV
ncbi:connectin-like [Achroia grisella]|uniref:connectin-like n=1 Tax=Achroia grisella TaxID=688607 RepID=UPI0027D20297|nr:connectin-like [Achroia grisella]